jgi:hypothetical protein
MPKMPAFVCFLLVLMALQLSNCQASQRNYKITLKDGRQFQCRGEPRFIRKTGYYRYHTYQNREAMLRADEVLMIEDMGS